MLTTVAPTSRRGSRAQRVGGEDHWIDVAYDAGRERVGRKTSLGHEEAVTRGVLGERARRGGGGAATRDLGGWGDGARRGDVDAIPVPGAVCG